MPLSLRVPQSLRTRDGFALVLVVLGIVGMMRHFTAAEAKKPGNAAAALKRPAVPIPGALGSVGRAGGSARRGEEPARDMRRLLRDFIIPFPGVKNLPVADALAVLQNHWQTLPHAVDPAPRADFVLNDAAARLLESGGPPVLVSLEIPGVSLLTNLRLLAAQAGMKVTFADSGAVLIPAEARASGVPQTAEWPLRAAVVETFSHAARRLRARHDPDSGEVLLNHSWILQPVFATRALSGTGLIREDLDMEIDLTPEDVEFEGFVDYGTRIPSSEAVAPVESLRASTELSNIGNSRDDSSSLDWAVREDEFTDMGRPVHSVAPPAIVSIFASMGISSFVEQRKALWEPFIDSGSPHSEEVCRLLRMALGYADLGQFGEAREYFGKVRAAAPDNPLFLQQLERREAALWEEINREETEEEWEGSRRRMWSGFARRKFDVGYSWSPETGMLSATGDARTLGVAVEVAAAIKEAAELGAKLEILAADWRENGNPPYEPQRDLSLRTNPPSTRVGVARLLSGAHDSVEFPAPPSRAYHLAMRLNDRLTVEIEAVGSRFQINAGVGCAARPDYLTDEATSGNSHKFDLLLVAPGQWVRMDIPSSPWSTGAGGAGEGAAARRESLFLRVSRASVSAE